MDRPGNEDAALPVDDEAAVAESHAGRARAGNGVENDQEKEDERGHANNDARVCHGREGRGGERRACA
jgi:hypothetical protein